mgnify:FL=1
MGKIALTPKTYLYPMPAVLVGAYVQEKANFMVIAYCGIVQHSPPMISIASSKMHWTNQGIHQARAFSINIPPAALVKKTDFAGIATGKNTDKSELFTVRRGTATETPLIDECPLNLECKLVQTFDFGGSNEVFFGEIVAAHGEESILTKGLPDIKKLDPIVFSMHDNTYWQVGEFLGRAWKIGNE